MGSGCLLVSHLMSTLVSYVSYNFNHSLCICIMVLLIMLYFWEFSSDILMKSIAAVSTENQAVDPLPSLQVLHHHVSSMERLSLTTRGYPLIIETKTFQQLHLIIPRESDCLDVMATIKMFTQPREWRGWRGRGEEREEREGEK